MKADIVIGANYGDEGKGTVVATIAKKHSKSLNILTNGGPQRAHTIVTEEYGDFTFKHLGSASCYNADSYFSEYFIINPIQLVNEYQSVTNIIGKPIKLFRNTNCRWTTPWDIIANQIIETLRDNKRHGSCGMGIWQTVSRYNASKYLSFDEFMQLDNKYNYLCLIKKHIENDIKVIPDSWKEIWNNPNMIYHFIDDCTWVYNNTVAVNNIQNIIDDNAYDDLIFENGQGLLLCDTGKDISGTTPSLTGCDYSLDIINQLQDKIDIDIHYVTRSYLTRHGNGNIETGQVSRQSMSQYVMADKYNFHNEFQGDFRYGKLDITKMSERISLDFNKASGMQANLILDVTHCDEIDNIHDIKKLFDKINTYDSAIIK